MAKPTAFQHYIYFRWLKGKLEFGSTVLKKRDVYTFLTRANIPKHIHKQFLSELEKKCLIKNKDQKNIEVLELEEQ